MERLKIGDKVLIDSMPFVVTTNRGLDMLATRTDGVAWASVYPDLRPIWDEILREYCEFAFMCTNNITPAYRVEPNTPRWYRYQTEMLRLELTQQQHTIATLIEKASREQLEQLEQLLIEISKGGA